MRSAVHVVVGVLCLASLGCFSDTRKNAGRPDAAGRDVQDDAPSDPGHAAADADAGVPDADQGPLDTAGDGLPDDVPPTDVPGDGLPDDVPLTDVFVADGIPGDPSPVDGNDDPVADVPDVPPSIGQIQVDCQIPFVLDDTRLVEAEYIGNHLSDLQHQSCVSGGAGGEDVAALSTMNVYGSHRAAESSLWLVQVASEGDEPRISVQIVFTPDSAVTTGSAWIMSLQGGGTVAAVVRHLSVSDRCVIAVGSTGTLTFSAARDTTLADGGSFAVNGTFDVVDCRSLPGPFQFPATSGCCP